MRVFLDANVLFSAAAAGSPTRQLLEAVLRGDMAVTNRHAWEEARRNIARKRPDLTPGLLRLESRLEFTDRFVRVEELDVPDADVPVVGGAVASRCSLHWTGDKRRFGPYYGRTVRGTKIVSGVMMAGEIGYWKLDT